MYQKQDTLDVEDNTFAHLKCIFRMNEKRSEMQTLSAGCSKAAKNWFVSDPLPGGAGLPKFNQMEMVITFTYRPSLVKIDAPNFQLLHRVA